MNGITFVNEQKKQHTFLMYILAAAAFLVLFQAYLVAPLIPALSVSFHVPVAQMGLLVPAYTIPYGLSSFVYGPISDRVGRKPILLALFGLLALSCLLIPFSGNISQLLLIRIVAGLATGGIVPVSVSLIGDVFAYEKRGKQIGLLFGAMAGGISFGASLGIFFNPILGWRNEFLIAGALSLGVFVLAVINHRVFPEYKATPAAASPVALVKDSWHLLCSGNGRRLYSYIFLNGMFHSGVFSWLGYYFKTKYALADQGIGLALLGYGIPGMLLGVTIGKLADRYGRHKIIPAGLALGALAAGTLIFHLPVWWCTVAITVLSLGYDMTQPLFAGMATSVGSETTRGLAVGLSACLLFLGYGTGSYLFQTLISAGLHISFAVFSGIELVLGLLALKVFKGYR